MNNKILMQTFDHLWDLQCNTCNQILETFNELCLSSSENMEHVRSLLINKPFIIYNDNGTASHTIISDVRIYDARTNEIVQPLSLLDDISYTNTDELYVLLSFRSHSNTIVSDTINYYLDHLSVINQMQLSKIFLDTYEQEQEQLTKKQ